MVLGEINTKDSMMKIVKQGKLLGENIMGIDYNQYCFVGFEIPFEDIENPEGFKFYDLVSDDIEYLVHLIEEKYDVSCRARHRRDEETLLVGIDISSELKNYSGYSKASLFDSSISIERLDDMKKEVQATFPDEEITLIFYNSVG